MIENENYAEYPIKVFGRKQCTYNGKMSYDPAGSQGKDSKGPLATERHRETILRIKEMRKTWGDPQSRKEDGEEVVCRERHGMQVIFPVTGFEAETVPNGEFLTLVTYS